MCQGLSNNYTQLLLTRILNGAGQSGNMPTTLSLIADFVPAEHLAQVNVRQPLTCPFIVLVACRHLNPYTSSAVADIPTKR